MTTKYERDDPRSFILRDENHPFGCEYEPYVVTMRRRLADMHVMYDVMGERCKWCKEEFIHASALRAIEKEDQKVKDFLRRHKTQGIDGRGTFRMPMLHPSIHSHYLLLGGTAELCEVGRDVQSSSSALSDANLYARGNSAVPAYPTETTALAGVDAADAA